MGISGSSRAGAGRLTVALGRRVSNRRLKLILKPNHLSSGYLSRHLKDRLVSQVVVTGKRQMSINFSDGTVLIVDGGRDELVVRIESESASVAHKGSPSPTKRQLEYLAFIFKYMQRFGRAPAESDIERHFLVSAPSVNQMMQMLERRGFITREPGVPRSIRLCVDLTAHRTLGTVR